jgi:hypothetical protein
MAIIKVKLDQYNVFKECDDSERDYMANTNPQVHPDMRDLIDRLTSKKPNWEFICANTGSRNPAGDRYVYSKFEIREMGEELGWINKETNWRDSSFSYIFDNERLKAARKRTSYTKSKDVKKAAKLICDNFYTRTPAELMKEVRQTLYARVSNNANRLSYDVRDTKSKLLEDFLKFAMANQDRFVDTIQTEKGKQLAVQLPDMIEKAKNSEDMRIANTSNKGAYVIERGNMFLVSRNESSEVVAYTLEDLPIGIKGDVALLKLVGNGEYIAGVGTRGTDNTFYVLNEGK